MTNIEFLSQRQSTPFLTDPKPSAKHVEQILAAGMRVPDHGCLQPWHFTVISDEGLQKLSDLFVQSSDSTTANLDKIAKMPFRAPMIIVVSTELCAHAKVPSQEQLIAAGCCVHTMQMAAIALGYGAMWRTGALAYNQKVKQGLGISEENELVGFLYIGTPGKAQRLKASKSFATKVSYWQ